jgi:hypothetical protein
LRERCTHTAREGKRKNTEKNVLGGAVTEKATEKARGGERKNRITAQEGEGGETTSLGRTPHN